MLFIQNDHRVRFVKVISDTCAYSTESGKINKEYGAAFYLLTATQDIWNRCERYIKNGIDFQAILESKHLSSGERVIVKLAWALFNAYGAKGFKINDMINDLDAENYAVCLEALRFRRLGDFQIDAIANG